MRERVTILRLLIFLILCNSKVMAATALMTIRGVVESVSVDAPVAVGTPFFIQLNWDTLTLENQPRNLLGPAWGEMMGDSQTSIDANLFQGTSVHITTMDAPNDSRAWFSIMDRLPDASDQTFQNTVSFQSSLSIFADDSQLPGSLLDWHLQTANFTWDFYRLPTASEPQGWSVGSAHFTSLTLVSIPELSVSGPLLGFLVCFLCKRRSWAGG